MLGIATIRPKAVLYSATEMPCASTAGELPTADCEPNISIMPTTVPNSPSKGLIEAIVPNDGEEAIQIACDRASGFFDGFFHHFGRAFDVLQAGREYASQRRAGGKFGQHAVADTALLEFLDDLVKQGGGRDTTAAQKYHAFNDQADCDDGCQDQKPDRPTGRFNDCKHADSPNVLKLSGRNCNVSHPVEQDFSEFFLNEYFANLPFEKSIFVYPQNLWITLWMTFRNSALMWRGIRNLVTLPIFYNANYL